MADLIDRDDFKSAFECVFRGKLDGMTAQDVTRRLRKLLKELPAVDAVPVVHAKWQERDGGKVMECSACHMPMAKTRVQWGEAGERYIHILTNYCPYCGAKVQQ